MLEPVFTPEQITELRKPLDDKTVKHRQGGGGSDLKYLAGFQVIDTANRIFGEGNWGYDLIEVLLNSVSDIKGEVIGGYYSARVKVSVKGCVPVTDEGVCAIQEARNPRAQVDAHDMARKGAITDAMKRAFRCFGNQFGNPLYDKDYGTTQATQPQRQQATTQATRAAVTPNSQQPRVMPAPAPQAAATPRPATLVPAAVYPVIQTANTSTPKPATTSFTPIQAPTAKASCPTHGTDKLKIRMVIGEAGPVRMQCCQEDFCDYMVAV